MMMPPFSLQREGEGVKYVYEAIIVPSGNALEARFPDLDIVTCGSDMANVAFMAQDLLENHIVVSLQKGRELPVPTFGNECPPDGYRMGIAVSCDENTPQEETMSVNEAADVLDVTPARIRAMIRDGVLSSRKVGMVHRVDAGSVMRRFNEPVRAGRPKKTAAAAR